MANSNPGRRPAARTEISRDFSELFQTNVGVVR